MRHTPTPDMLRARADLMREVRDFFDQRQFLEVMPPCLLPECIVDAAIEPIRVSASQIGGNPSDDQDRSQTDRYPANQNQADWYLQTSPELAMKCYLANGSGSIYAISPVFRGHEWGRQHRPEFSMLEWYEIDADSRAGAATLGRLAMQLFDCDAYETKSYRTTFQETIGLDPISASTAKLCELVDAFDPHLASTLSNDRDDLLDALLTHRIQPNLGTSQPLVIDDYPISQAALAKQSDNDPNCAARFELFYQGVELANGYDELLDADVLIGRVEATNLKRQESGKRPIDPPASLINAMRNGLPASAGVAMGLDRVLMLLSEADDIGKVQ